METFKISKDSKRITIPIWWIVMIIGGTIILTRMYYGL